MHSVERSKDAEMPLPAGLSDSAVTGLADAPSAASLHNVRADSTHVIATTNSCQVRNRYVHCQFVGVRKDLHRKAYRRDHKEVSVTPNSEKCSQPGAPLGI